MSENKWTPEPWVVDTDGAIYADHDEGNFEVAVGIHNRGDADRIVACVNAFADVDTDAIPELPDGTVAGLLALCKQGVETVRALRAQRDELAWAARDFIEGQRGPVSDDQPRNRILVQRAAISIERFEKALR